MNRRLSILLPGLAIFVITIIAYIPAMRAGYVWDDDAYVTNNQLLTVPDGLARIWFSLDSPSQYFPLVYTTFRIEHAIWGFDPTGYHVVNVLLHIINALLIWLILSRLRIRGAWIAAAIWALHPVNVESVGWITERKNTLSTVFYLTSLLAWMEFADEEEKHPWRFYALSLVLFQLALFAKTTACTLPAALVLVLWLRREKAAGPLDRGDRPLDRGGHCILDFGLRILDWGFGIHRKTINHQPSTTSEPTSPGLAGPSLSRRGAAPGFAGASLLRRGALVAPYVVLGLAMGLVSIWWEQHHQGTKGTLFAFTPVERILIASRALWFYLGKLIWPARLIFSYPRWHIDPADPVQYLWLAACLIAVALIYWKRRQIGRGPIAALVFFAATLAPMLGFISLYTFYFSFVADHYQYLASIGPMGLMGHLLAKWGAPRPRYALAAAILAALGVLTWRQSGLYKDEDTLWRDTIARNPSAWMAHYNLGLSYAVQGQSAQAVERFTDTIRYNPSYAEAHNNLGLVYESRGMLEPAIAHYRKAIELKPRLAEAHGNLANALASAGRLEEAVREHGTAIRLDPANPISHNDFAATLIQLRDLEQAESECRTALRLRPDYPEAHLNLAVVLFYKKDLAGAWSEVRRAEKLGMAPNPAFLEALSKSTRP